MMRIRMTSTAIVALTVSLVQPGDCMADHGALPPHWIAGSITGSRTLTAAAPGPTYVLYGDLRLEPGTTLTIESGVTIRAVPKSDFFASGDWLDRAEIIVAGELRLLGTPASPVVLLSDAAGSAAGATSDDWGGIRILPGASLVASYASIGHAKTGIESLGASVLESSSIADCSFAAIRVHPSGSVTGTNCDIVRTSAAAAGYGALTLINSRITDCAVGVAMDDAAVTLIGTVLTRVADGIAISRGSFTARSAQILGRPEVAGTGIRLTLCSVDIAPIDLSAPSPTLISGFGNWGMYLDSCTGTVRNGLIYKNLSWAVLASGPLTFNYCTIAGNNGGLQGVQSVTNSIVALNPSTYGAGAVNGAYRNSCVWGNTPTNFLGAVTNPEGTLSVFDPRFVAPEQDNYRLSPASLYRDFSSSGGEIGAYGPGAGAPTIVRTASVISQSAKLDGVRIQWLCSGAAGGTALIFRRLGSDDWEVREEVPVNAESQVDFIDRSAAPGLTYRYGVGVRSSTGVAVEGIVEISVPAVPSLQLAASNSRAGVLRLIAPRGGRVAMEFMSASGRRLAARTIHLDGPGVSEIDVPDEASGIPGIVFVKARLGAEVANCRMVVLK